MLDYVVGVREVLLCDCDVFLVGVVLEVYVYVVLCLVIVMVGY